MRVLLIGLLLVGIALAGCSSKGSNDDGEEIAASTSTSATSSSGSRSSSSASSSASSSTTTTSSSTSTSTAPAPAKNGVPIAVISATINGTKATFSLDGSDPDKDALTWTLDFGDASAKTNGTTLPTSVDHTYAAAGNFTVLYSVSDGKNVTNSDLDITVTVASTGIVMVQEQALPSNPVSSQDLEGAFLGAQACGGWIVSENGQDCVWFEMKAEHVGKTFTLSTNVGDPDYEIWPACGFFATFLTESGPFATDGSIAAGPHTGLIDAEGCLVAWVKEPSMDLPTHTLKLT